MLSNGLFKLVKLNLFVVVTFSDVCWLEAELGVRPL